jgi:capsular exopolysaccharide synthesis family protein
MSKFSKALEQAQRDRALRARPAPTDNGQPTEPRPARLTQRTPVMRRRGAGQTGAVDDHLVSLVAPAGLEAEQYRALRHIVEQKRRTDNLAVIAVSSPGGGDGKTITAINLAGALAQAPDARVLLLEADLRRPSIGPLLGLNDPGAPGLVHAILDPGVSLAHVVQRLTTFNLSVVVAGQTLPSPYEVLKSPRLAELLDEARRDYDYVVLDTPPMVPVQDCRLIARLVDGLVLVVAAHRTPRPMLEAALNIIDPTRLIGLVFNRYDHLLAGRHLGYNAGYYAPPSGAHGSDARKTGSLGRLLRRGDGPKARSRRATDRSR